MPRSLNSMHTSIYPEAQMHIPIVRRWIVLAALVLAAPLGCSSDSKSPTDPGEDIEPPKATSLALSQTSLAFAALQDSSQLTATVKDQHGNTMADATISWASTDTAVAKVNSRGWVFAVATGSARIIAASGPLADTATVTVAQNAASLVLDVDSASFEALGDSIQLTATVKDKNGNDIEAAVVEWTSSDTTVASVDEEGWVVSRGNGSASIIASAGEAADTVAVDVQQVAVGLSVRPNPAAVGENDTLRLEGVVVDRNGYPIPDVTITWSSASPATATVNEDGLVTGKHRGSTTTVTAKAGEFADTVTIRVMDQIVFANAAGEIYVIHDDGSGERRLLDGGGSRPVWSPNGQKIAYEYASGDSRQIWVMNADGTGKTQLTTEGTNRNPVWSPDGQKIAFASNRGGTGTDKIYVMNADGSNQTKLTTNLLLHESAPAWSPLGDKIAFVRTFLNTGGRVFVINADGTDETRITDSTAAEGHPKWSPVGNKIAFQSNQSGRWRLYVTDLAASTMREFVDNAPTSDWEFPEWSPDGDRILFQLAANGETRIGVTDGENKQLTVSTFHPGAHARFPKWSPDGEFALYAVEGDGLYRWSVGSPNEPDKLTEKGGDMSSIQHDWRPRTLNIIIPPILP